MDRKRVICSFGEDWYKLLQRFTMAALAKNMMKVVHKVMVYTHAFSELLVLLTSICICQYKFNLTAQIAKA